MLTPLAEPRTAALEASFVRLEGVSKRFGSVVALKDATLDIARGEIMTLLGPSGGGKTTLLNLLAGFLSPDTGTILIGGESVGHVPSYRRNIGVLFQNYALFPHMNVAANVGYGLKMRGAAKTDIGRKVAEALALVRLTGYEERKPRQLSGGQQQRVALARALAISPHVLLLDEPFSALDKSLRGSMQLELKEIQRRLGVTTIFVTHDQSEALSLSDRIAILSDGCIRQIGTPETIYRQPADRFVASFVGEANVFRARLDRITDAKAIVVVGETVFKVPSEPLVGCAPGADVDLFLRPEQMRIAGPGENALCAGTVAAQSYQGGYLDIHIDAVAAVSGRLSIRASAEDGTCWSIGTPVMLTCIGFEASAFPSAS